MVPGLRIIDTEEKMIDTLKKYVPLLIGLACSSVHAQTEEYCVAQGRFAESTAELLRFGETEERVRTSTLDPSTQNPNRPRIRQKIINDRNLAVIAWVYTVRPDPSDARATVYAKCMLGGLGYIDWSKHPAAVNAG